MPKPLLTRPETRNLTGTTLSTAPIQQHKLQTQQMNKMELDRYLRKKRSKNYIQTMCELDIGGHVQNQQKVKRIIDVIHNEFPEVEINGIMLGIVSICYLGKPYEVHTLDVTGQIIEHYPGGKALPGGLEKARSLALRGGYAFVEVYVDCCRAIGRNGSVAVIPC